MPPRDAALSQDIWVTRAQRLEGLDGPSCRYGAQTRPGARGAAFGAVRYSVRDMSVVVDDDCMSAAVKPVMKYLNPAARCKIYTKWDDRGSLLF